jgi:hypothetical protein
MVLTVLPALRASGPLNSQGTKIMSFLETMGEAALLRAEGNRQLANALAEGFGRLKHAVAKWITNALNHGPNQHLHL